MGATFVMLVLTAAADAPRQEPPAPQDRIIGSGSDAAPTVVVQDGWAQGIVAGPTYPNSATVPPLGLGVRGWGPRAGAASPGKFGYFYYYSRIPHYGPTCYNYRWQFDYPWHR